MKREPSLGSWLFMVVSVSGFGFPSLLFRVELPDLLRYEIVRKAVLLKDHHQRHEGFGFDVHFRFGLGLSDAQTKPRFRPDVNYCFQISFVLSLSVRLAPRWMPLPSGPLPSVVAVHLVHDTTR